MCIYICAYIWTDGDDAFERFTRRQGFNRLTPGRERDVKCCYDDYTTSFVGMPSPVIHDVCIEMYDCWPSFV